MAATEIVSRRFQGKSLDGWWTSAAIDGRGKRIKRKKQEELGRALENR